MVIGARILAVSGVVGGDYSIDAIRVASGTLTGAVTFEIDLRVNGAGRTLRCTFNDDTLMAYTLTGRPSMKPLPL